MSTMDPGTMVEITATQQGILVAAGETANFDTNIDVTEYERVLCFISIVGATTSTTVVTPKEANTSGAATTAITAAGTLALTATDDDSTAMLDVRLHGADKFFNLDITVTGGTSATYHVVVLGWKQDTQFTTEFQALSTAVAESAMTAA